MTEATHGMKIEVWRLEVEAGKVNVDVGKLSETLPEILLRGVAEDGHLPN